MRVSWRHEVALVSDLRAVGILTDHAPEEVHTLGESRLLSSYNLFVKFKLVLEVRQQGLKWPRIPENQPFYHRFVDLEGGELVLELIFVYCKRHLGKVVGN